jgi:hypothetical protein
MRHHLSCNIAGILKRPDSFLKKLLGDGTRDAKQIRAELEKMLAEGKRLIPSVGCDGFDYVTGCPGHPDETENHPAKEGAK